MHRAIVLKIALFAALHFVLHTLRAEIPIALQPADTTTYYADTACYLKPLTPTHTDTLAQAWLTRLGTISCLFNQHLNNLPATAAPTTNIVLLPPLLPSDILATDTAQLPPPLWYNVKNLPQFTPQEIEVQNFIQPLRLQSPVKTLLFYIFLFIAILYAFLSYNYAKYLQKLYEAVLNIYIARQFYEDFNHNVFIMNLLFGIITVGTFGLFAYLGVDYFGKFQHADNYLLMSALAVAIGGYLSLRRLMLRFIAFILPLSEVIYFYLFNLRIINIALSVALLPLLLLMAFGVPLIEKTALYMAIATTGISLIFIVFRGLTIVKEFVWRYKFHFFLYLCTLEIAPLLVMYKVVSGYLV